MKMYFIIVFNVLIVQTFVSILVNSKTTHSYNETEKNKNNGNIKVYHFSTSEKKSKNKWSKIFKWLMHIPE